MKISNFLFGLVSACLSISALAAPNDAVILHNWQGTGKTIKVTDSNVDQYFPIPVDAYVLEVNKPCYLGDANSLLGGLLQGDGGILEGGGQDCDNISVEKSTLAIIVGPCTSYSHPAKYTLVVPACK